ncbi:MAG: hypothetical protein JWN33_159 [Candidatus Saccharibacteria bacterium]|nr:hypothetical protein [Candidatus Saccharibacteria bacterium]
MIVEMNSEQETLSFGRRIGEMLRGGEVIELVGDMGAGKTTLTKGIALGLGITEDIQSPTFTISRVYDTPAQLRLFHYDFYRLNDPGIMQLELQESITDPSAITIIEWAGIVQAALPDNRLRITFTAPSELSRRLELSGHLLEGLMR